MKNVWETWTGIIPPQLCDQWVARLEKYPPQPATIGFDGGEFSENNDFRRSVIRWVQPLHADKDIADLMMTYVRSSNRTNFGFDIDTMNEIQFTEYHATENGHYDWHHDIWLENPAPFDRKLSVVIQLSDPFEYEGGRFEFLNVAEPHQFLPKGSLLIFPSYLVHRVTPVTKGTRKSLVSWIEGPKWR